MLINNIITEIDAEIARLTQAKALLAGTNRIKSASGRPTATVGATNASLKPKRKKRRLSAEARARIAEAQRKRWAAQKSKAK
jgi:hypothetical protein